MKASSESPTPSLDSLETLITTMPLGIVATIAAARQDTREEVTKLVDPRAITRAPRSSQTRARARSGH
jgi:hypothetical protein